MHEGVTGMEDEEVGTTVTFSGYGRTFQRKVVQALIVDHHWASQMVDVMRTEYFDLSELRFLTDQYFRYYARYRCFPSFECLIGITREELQNTNDDVLKQRVIAFLQDLRSNADVGDLPWVKEKSLDFCRKQEIKESLERIVDKVEDAEYDDIVDELKRAVSRGACESVGHDFSTDREARFVEFQRRPIATGIPELDGPSILRGGLSSGELGVVTAPTGVGKCSTADTYIHVQYDQVVINGITYEPWDEVGTKRGRIKACEVQDDDELV